MAELCSCSTVFRKWFLKNFEGATWLHLTDYSKIWEERHDLKIELLSKNELELWDLENSLSIHIAKKREKVYSEGNAKGVAMSDFIFWAPKSLQMVTAAMKLKDSYSLEGKLWPT